MDGITVSKDMSLTKFREIMKDKGSLVSFSPWYCIELDTLPN